MTMHTNDEYYYDLNIHRLSTDYSYRHVISLTNDTRAFTVSVLHTTWGTIKGTWYKYWPIPVEAAFFLSLHFLSLPVWDGTRCLSLVQDIQVFFEPCILINVNANVIRNRSVCSLKKQTCFLHVCSNELVFWLSPQTMTILKHSLMDCCRQLCVQRW